MKKITYIILLTLVAGFASCKKQLDSEGLSKITYYANFEMTGDALIFQPLGTAFTDPGIKALSGTAELPVTTVVNGTYTDYTGNTVNANVSDKYVITYSAKNSDGFAGTDTRTVFVAKTGDFVNSIEGLYTSTVIRNGASGAQYTDMQYVLVWKSGTNTYTLSDGIGGYYDLGRNYGPAYSAGGCTVTANNISTNDFTLGPHFEVGAFAGDAALTSFSVNAANKTITFNTTWVADPSTTYKFAVTLTQVPF